MALAVKHSKVSAIADGADTSVVRPSDWNADHSFAGATSGGIPFFSSATVMDSSSVLTASALVLGGGAGTAPATMASLGTTTTVLHGNAAGAPTFGAVSLTADVSGVLPAASGGAGGNPGYIAANWYPVCFATYGSGAALSANTVRLIPFTVNQTITLSELAATLTTISAAGNFQLAIYANDTALALPTGLPVGYTLATLSTGTTGNINGALNANTQLIAGRTYWAGITADNAVAIFTAFTATSSPIGALAGDTTLNSLISGTNGKTHISAPHTYANNLSTLNLTGATFTTVLTPIRCAAVFFKVFSVP